MSYAVPERRISLEWRTIVDVMLGPVPFPLEEPYLREAEQALGVRLPSSYRARIMAGNGGTVMVAQDPDHTYELFTVLDRSSRKRLSRTSGSELVRENGVARGWPGYPENVVAVGEDGGGNYLVLMHADGVAAPGVFDWFHETGQLTLLADDFGELVSVG